jgi:hypothetical protein
VRTLAGAVQEEEVVFLCHPEPVHVNTSLGSWAFGSQDCAERAGAKLFIAGEAEEQRFGVSNVLFLERAAVKDELSSGEGWIGWI